ncbi:MAG: 50S ribosomal protein L9, partial [Actinobacteria bacterium]|nr:50S ribosomal protein L9 [Actinomycetota bacterium]
RPWSTQWPNAVAQGSYGRNRPSPRAHRRARTSREARDTDHANEMKSALEANKVRLAARAGDSGRLFGAVTVTDIVEAISALGVKVDKRRVEIGSPIKTTGSYTVTVKVHPQVTATVQLQVVAAK